MLLSQGKSSDAAAHQVGEEANVVASNAVDCTDVCNDLSSVSGLWKRLESRKTVTEKLSYKKTKGNASN